MSTIIPANVLHTALEKTVNKVCYLLPILTQTQTELHILSIALPLLWSVQMKEYVLVVVIIQA